MKTFPYISQTKSLPSALKRLVRRNAAEQQAQLATHITVVLAARQTSLFMAAALKIGIWIVWIPPPAQTPLPHTLRSRSDSRLWVSKCFHRNTFRREEMRAGKLNGVI